MIHIFIFGVDKHNYYVKFVQTGSNFEWKLCHFMNTSNKHHYYILFYDIKFVSKLKTGNQKNKTAERKQQTEIISRY